MLQQQFIVIKGTWFLADSSVSAAVAREVPRVGFFKSGLPRACTLALLCTLFAKVKNIMPWLLRASFPDFIPLCLKTFCKKQTPAWTGTPGGGQKAVSREHLRERVSTERPRSARGTHQDTFSTYFVQSTVSSINRGEHIQINVIAHKRTILLVCRMRIISGSLALNPLFAPNPACEEVV